MKQPLTEIEAFRAQELLLQRATEGLSDAEAAELAALGADDDFSFDLAAAAIDIATLPVEAMPAGVADKVLMSAGLRPAIPTTLAGILPPRPSLADAASSLRAVDPLPPATDVIPIASRSAAASIEHKRRSRVPMIVAWCAAAAAIVLAIWAWQREPAERVVQREPVAPAPSEARAQLLANGGDVQTLAWSATADPMATGARGDVVWSPSRQEGYMRFVGLAANDPTKTQYQLWIFDKTRDDRYPIDGGVFDVGPGGEVIVKISPKLHVNSAALFAVTVEAPGGVVVSKREHIVVTAKTG